MKQSYLKFLPPAGIILSLAILFAIASQFRYNFSTIFSINPLFLLLAFISSILLLIVQAVRFKYIVDNFSGFSNFPFLETLLVRMGSQFVAMTTPGYVGGEVARAAWLASKGVEPGRALWLPYIEIIFDVISSNIVAFVAGLYAIYFGNYFLGSIVILVSSAIFVLIWLLVFFSRKEGLTIPIAIVKILRKILSETRSSWVIEKGNRFLTEFSYASLATLNRKNARQIAIIAIYTVALVIITGSTLYLISMGLSFRLNLLLATLAVFVSIVLGNLPITLGGSGIAELSVYYYTGLVLGFASWPLVFTWRIVSYIFPLFLTGITANIALHRFTVNPTRSRIR